MSVIANMKKSVLDCLGRRDACRDGVRSNLEFVNSCKAYRRPNTSIEQFIQHGAGDCGVFVAYNKKTKRLSSAALLSEPAANRETYWMSPLLSALINFRGLVSDFSVQDAAGIVILLKVLNNLEVVIQLLSSGELLEGWNERWNQVGGLPGWLLTKVNERTGGVNISSGNIRRYQAHSNKMTETGIPGRYLTDLVEAVVSLSIRSYQKDWEGATDQQIMNMYDDCCMALARIGPNGRKEKAAKDSAFGITNQSCVKMLFLTGIVKPLGAVQFARIPSSNNNQKKRKNKPLEDFISASSDNIFVAAQKYQDGICTFLKQAYKDAGYANVINHAVLENETCENDRSAGFGARDLVFPNQYFAHYVPATDGNGDRLELYFGRFDEQARDFGATYHSNFEGLNFTTHGLVEIQSPPGVVPMKLRCDITQESGAELAREAQMVLTEETIGPVAMEEIKIYMVQPVRCPAQYQGLLDRIAGIREVRDLLHKRKVFARVPSRQLEDKRMQSKRWNSRPDEVAAAVLPRLPRPVTAVAVAVTPVTPSPGKKRRPTTTHKKRRSRWSDAPTKSQKKVSWAPVLPYQEAVPVLNVDTEETEAVERVWPKVKVTVLDVDRELEEREEHNPAAVHLPRMSELAAATHAPSPPPPGINPDLSLEPIPYIYNVDSERMDLSDDQLSLILGSTPSSATTPNRNRQRLPTVRESDAEYQMDWSPGNLERILEPRHHGDVLRKYVSNPRSNFYFCGRGFGGLHGTRDLQNANSVTVLTQNLLDHARNAINSVPPRSRPSLPGRASTLNRELRMTDLPCVGYLCKEGDRRLYVCHSERTPELVFNRVGECLLCDDVALKLLGERFHDDTRFWWGFPDEDSARDFYLLATFLTTGSSQFYKSLHNSARRVYRRIMRHAQNLDLVPQRAGRQGRDSPQLEQDRFVVRFGRDNNSCPFFVLIGKLGEEDRTGKLSSPEVLHDFCIAIPSRNTWEKGKKRSTQRYSGNALYVRPLHSDAILHLPNPDGSRKKPPPQSRTIQFSL